MIGWSSVYHIQKGPIRFIHYPWIQLLTLCKIGSVSFQTGRRRILVRPNCIREKDGKQFLQIMIDEEELMAVNISKNTDGTGT